MAKPIGSEVMIYYDSAVVVSVGDYLQTNTGRSYDVVKARVQQRGEVVGRQHLRCIVVLQEDVEEGATIHKLQWYERGHAWDGIGL